MAGLINITDNILLRVAWTNKQYNKHPQKGFSLGMAGLINIAAKILLGLPGLINDKHPQKGFSLGMARLINIAAKIFLRVAWTGLNFNR